MPPTTDELTKLLEETRAIAEDNNRLLREMRRNALLGLGARILLWLAILGAIPFILGPLLAPFAAAFRAQEGSQGVPAGLFGLPSQDQVQQLIDQYQGAYELE